MANTGTLPVPCDSPSRGQSPRTARFRLVTSRQPDCFTDRPRLRHRGRPMPAPNSIKVIALIALVIGVALILAALLF